MIFWAKYGIVVGGEVCAEVEIAEIGMAGAEGWESIVKKLRLWTTQSKRHTLIWKEGIYDRTELPVYL
ncbi:hypothetical protein FACS1894111_06240 [Clostridia bacterium]|nr:hypothetical protein FACS1894111_06240 [Clostridia bacterium]